PVVHLLADPQRPGPGGRHQDPERVPEDGGERAVVEQRPAPAQQPPLLHLRGPAGPAELVVPPPPHVADHEDGQRQVREDDPPQQVTGAHPGHGRGPSDVRYSGGANGSRPPRPRGGPPADTRRMSARSRTPGAGSRAHTASTSAAYGVPARWTARRSSSSSARRPRRRRSPRGASAANSSTTGR